MMGRETVEIPSLRISDCLIGHHYLMDDISAPDVRQSTVEYCLCLFYQGFCVTCVPQRVFPTHRQTLRGKTPLSQAYPRSYELSLTSV